MIRLHIKGSELKQLHNKPGKSFHLVNFQAKVSMEEYIEILKKSENSIIKAELKIKRIKK